MISYCIFSSLINAVASLVLGIAVFSKKPREPKTLIFTWLTVNIAVWSGLYFGWMMSREPGTALIYCRALSAAAILIPVCYYHFATRLTGRPHNREVLAGYGLAVILAGLCATPLIVARVEPAVEWFPVWPKAGLLYPAYLGFFFYYFVRVTWLLGSEYRRSAFLRKNQLLYVLVYTLAGYLGGSSNYFLWYDVPVPPLGNVLVAVYMIGVAYAMIRFRLMDFNLLIVRSLSYGLIILAFAGLEVVLAAGLQQLLGGGPLEMAALFLAALAATTLLFGWMPLWRARVDRFLERRMLREAVEGRSRLRQLTQTISTLKDEESIFRETVGALAEALAVGRVALYLRFEFETAFNAHASIPPGTPAPLDAEEPLLKLLQASPHAVLLDELAHSLGPADRAAIDRLRQERHIELAVPVHAGAFFYGFFALGPRKFDGLYSENDLSLLEAIGLQVGFNLRSRQLERRANQAEKLISLGTLAAGLAHELRNPLVSIRTFSALMEEQGGDPEFRREFRTVVDRDARRIAAIVENVAAFAENTKVKFSPVQMEDVIQAVYEIARPEFVSAGVAFVVPAPAGLPPVQGNYSQMLQVFLNLFQNAIHALAGRPDPRIEVRYQVQPEAGGGHILMVTVADNGAGIEPAVRPQIFEPFVTTKATGDRHHRRGMGLGLAIVKRIIEGHRGGIAVSSEPGRGTTFVVHLPCQT